MPNSHLPAHPAPIFLQVRACACAARLKAISIKKEHGTKKLGEATVDFALGGMRGILVSS
jgi:hypothetical protein